MQQQIAGRTGQVPLRIDEPAITHFLLNPDKRRILVPFYGAGATVTQAAGTLGESSNRVLKCVYGLVNSGLLEVRHTTRRGGRPIKTYGVTHERFFVPFQATNAATLEDLLLSAVEEPNRLAASALCRLVEGQASHIGYLVSLQADGRLTHSLTVDGERELRAEDLPKPWHREGSVLWLSEHQARSFLQEQEALVQKYAGLNSPGAAERYLAFSVFTPLLLPPCPTPDPEEPEAAEGRSLQGTSPA